MNLFTKQETGEISKTVIVTKRGNIEEEINPELRIHVDTLLYKMGNHQGPAVQHRSPTIL